MEGGHRDWAAASGRERDLPQEIEKRVADAFPVDTRCLPTITLRAADAIDSYAEPPPFDGLRDEPTDEYLEKYTYWAQAYLDPVSWRHYLPRWIDYAMRHPSDAETMVVHGLLESLRPPDRVPARFATLTREEQASIVALLTHIATSAQFARYHITATDLLAEWRTLDSP